MSEKQTELNSFAAWEQARAERQSSPLRGVFSRIRLVLSWQDAPEAWAEIAARLDQIQRRYEDPYLKLAVIGDFSCGKSTFLNAILGQSLLKMALLATTAVPTYIRWNGGRNAEPRVTVLCPDQRSYEITGPDRAAFEARIGRPLPQALDAVIDAVTTDNTLAEIIERVELSLPEQENRYSLCLIDTPGVNPGADDTQRHVLETRRVLREEADCALVLSPAKALFTDSFLMFLQENAEHFLHDAIFMITQMDRADHDEGAEDLRQYAETLLLDLGVEAPQVRCISARSALRSACGEVLSPEEQRWAVAFEQDMQEIFRDLSQRRNAIARSSSVAVLKQLTADLERDLNEKKAALESRRGALARWSPEAMKTECRQIVQDHKTSLALQLPRWTRELNEAIGRATEKCRNTIHGKIQGYNTGVTLNHYLNSQAHQDLNALKPPILEQTERISLEIRKRHDALCKNLVQCLNRYKMQITGEAARHYAISSDLKQEENKLQNLWQVTAMAKTSTGLTALGELASDLTDVLGDLWTFSLGEAFSDLGDVFLNLFSNVAEMFTPMKTRRENARQHIDDYLNRAGDTLREQCLMQMHNIQLTSCMQADRLPDQLEKDYAPLFEAKKLVYEKDMAALSAQIQCCTDHLVQLAACAEILQSDRD